MLWSDEDHRAGRVAAALATVLDRAGWRREIDEPGRIVLVRGQKRRPVVHRLGDEAVLIGFIFDRTATEAGRVEPLALSPEPVAFDPACMGWCTYGWGAYVAIRQGPRHDVALFRDPIGMLDCAYWKHGGLTIVTSTPERLLDDAPPAGLTIDWRRVAGVLRVSGSVGETLALTGVETVPPGHRVHISGAARDHRRVWSPADFVRMPASRDALERLPRLVDACIAAWCSTSDLAIGELSGGLDSAIVAAGVAQLPSSPVARWFNYHAVDPQGDERRYAGAVADRLGLTLTTGLRDNRVIDDAVLATLPLAVRPVIGSLSFFHDAHLAARGQALGADMLLTGQGGDALFFQPASLLIAGDLPLGPRHWRRTAAAIGDLAQWSEQTIWSVLAAMIRTRMAAPNIPLSIDRTGLLDPDLLTAPAPIAWLDDVAGLPAAKQLQIRDLAACSAAFGPSWCASVMRVVHPLMSQPLLEHVLPIPAIALTQGKRDRASAREAYRERLPALVIDRRGKGDISSFFGRMLAASLPFLRTYLLDGHLVAQGVVRSDRLDACLRAEHLMQTNDYSELFFIVMMEHWTRGWSDRLADIAQRAAVDVDGSSFAK